MTNRVRVGLFIWDKSIMAGVWEYDHHRRHTFNTIAR